MPDQFCPHCGTEVDEDARFCPTCGRTLRDDRDEPDATYEDDRLDAGAPPSPIPPAPAWPEQEPMPPSAESEAALAPQSEAPGEREEREEAPTEADEADEDRSGWVAAAPPAPASPPAASPPGPATGEPAGESGGELPFTVPTMLSAWLIGSGSGLAALALLPRLANVLNVVLFLALLWVCATVFLADRLPQFAQQRLAVLVVVMVASGAALDRAGFRVNVNSIFLITVLIAAAGVLLLELGRDRPVQTGS